MRKLVTVFILSLLMVSPAWSDDLRLPLRQCCMDEVPSLWPSVPTRSGTATSFFGDVRVPIILVAYQDVPFTIENVREVWNDIANKPGYSEHGAVGSMADYFYEQSHGQFRVTFDVIGPVTLPEKREYYGMDKGGRTDVGINQMIMEACNMTNALPDVDFSRYDWDGDGSVETVLVVYAGVGQNYIGAPADVVWPKQGYIGGRLDNKIGLRNYACANELGWPSMQQEGFGTLIHEFSHCLGLPDLYNVSVDVNDYIIFDEWDVMDGGCYANDSWAPVGYSAYERYLCGWLEPEALPDDAGVEAMAPMYDGGKVYRLDHSSGKEYLLFENRQQQCFDSYLPGHGLLVTHVGSSNINPNNGTMVTVYPIPADGLDYPHSFKKYVQDYYGVTLSDDSLNMTGKYKKYQYDENGRSRLMTGTAFPYMEGDNVVNDALTIFSKTISGIREENGRIFFHVSSAEDVAGVIADDRPVAYYDLQGRLSEGRSPGIYIVRYPNGTTKKCIRR